LVRFFSPTVNTLSVEIKVGCCGFPGGMAAYFKNFSLAEVQKTFYRPPRLETVRRWRDKAPREFEFTLKAWQVITHPASSPTYRRAGIRIDKPENCGFFKPTEEVREAWNTTLEVARALEARIVVFQCPASFKPLEENLGNMRRFFSSIEREGLILAWEPRGGWDATLIAGLCKDLDLVHCVDPFLAEPAVAGETAYLRLHGYEGGRMYYHDYTREELEYLLRVCRSLESREVYCLFNNIRMEKNALEFKELLRGPQPRQGQA